MNYLRLIPTLLFVVSCSGAQVSSSKKIPISFDIQDEHVKKVNLESKIDYFLWGIVPRNYTIDIDEVFMRKGFNSVANINFRQGTSVSDFFLTIITLGFYLPQTLYVEGYVNPYKLNQF